MNGWSQDARSIPYTSNGAFNHQNTNAINNTINPSATTLFNQDGFDAFQAAQFPQRLPDNAAALQGFQNSPYQVNSVVPSKRPRPSEDTMAQSPRPSPMNYPGQTFQAPNPYQHLRQAGSSTATPSPVMQDGHFRASGVPQRFQTHSPHPFSPTSNSLGANSSPQPDQLNTGRTALLQGNLAYGQGVHTGQGFNPGQILSTGMPSASLQSGYPAPGVQLSQNLQQRQQDKQREYQMRLQQHQQQLQATNMAARHQGTGANPMTGIAMHDQQQQYHVGIGSQNTHAAGSSPPRTSPEAFLKLVSDYMRSVGRHFNAVPYICGRPISLAQLFSFVMKSGGSAYINATGKWPVLSANMNFDPQHFPTAPQELKQVWDQNLAPYEAAWFAKRQQKAFQQHQMSGNIGYQSQISAGRTTQGPASVSDQQVQQFAQSQQQPSQSQPVTAAHVTATPYSQTISQPNGYFTPQHHQAQSRAQPTLIHHKSNLSEDISTATPGNQQAALSTPVKESTQKPRAPSPSVPPDMEAANGISTGQQRDGDRSVYTPMKRVLTSDNASYGGLKVDAFSEHGRELARTRPNVPEVQEMGLIDIEALTLSLQSGLNAEVRLALDHLVRISKLEVDGFLLDLQQCDDLVDVFVECGEHQLEFLAEHAAEVSDVVDLDSYEDVMRNTLAEANNLQDVPEFGTLEYELGRAVDRLIAITTILRNLSCIGMDSNHRLIGIEQTNQALLAEEIVIKFLSSAIRHIGTRHMFLRRHINTQDFMKDVLVLLSNTADKIKLPSKEDAVAVLHFLLSFAPSPPPHTANTDFLQFASFQPHRHVYLPPAIESLAKLLARDDPNRTFYKSIFQADATSSPPSELLTRAFGLVVSMVPARTEIPDKQLMTANVRLPGLAHSMLAADILASLIPNSEHPIARTWLESDDGSASALLHLACRLMRPEQRTLQSGRVDPERNECINIIVRRGLSMLTRLLEKSDDLSSFRFPMGILPKKETLVQYMLRPPQEIDPIALRQLCAIAKFDR